MQKVLSVSVDKNKVLQKSGFFYNFALIYVLFSIIFYLLFPDFNLTVSTFLIFIYLLYKTFKIFFGNVFELYIDSNKAKIIEKKYKISIFGFKSFTTRELVDKRENIDFKLKINKNIGKFSYFYILNKDCNEEILIFKSRFEHVVVNAVDNMSRKFKSS
jgi:hypothetical protein